MVGKVRSGVPWRTSSVLPAITMLSWSAVLLLGFAAVLVSPFGLREIERVPGLNWDRLANVGQTYEAVAALLAVPTFGGVVISLLVQRRDVQAGQEQTALLTQIELVRLAVEYPSLAGADGTLPEQYSIDQAREYMMINLSVSKWRSLFGVGHLSAEEVRLLLSRLFKRAQARAWWELAGESYGVGVRGLRKRFYEIAQAEWSRARRSGSANAEAARARRASGRLDRDMVKAGSLLLGAAATGVISGWLITRNRRPR